MGDVITHVNPIRVRIKGEGDLQALLLSLGDEAEDTVMLSPEIIPATSRQSTTFLCNFRAERAAIEFQITEMDEYFTISNIWAYVKQTAASYPQV